MNLGQRLKALRKQLHLSQEAIGAQGFVSAPGWIKIENSQRQPSDALIGKLVRWLVEDGYLTGSDSDRLREELLTLKYLSHRSEFVRGLARTHHQAYKAAGPSPTLTVPEPAPGEEGRGRGRSMRRGVSARPARPRKGKND